MNDIVYQNKDITAKLMAETLRGKSLSAFGLPHLKIIELLPTNLPAIESNELRLDNLFLLSDGSIAIIDYESEFTKENFVKYLNYIARVIKRYAVNHQLDELTQLKMIVIYTADVTHADNTYDLGGITLTIEQAFLMDINTSETYQCLKRKIDKHQVLTDEELMQLIILPLTIKGKEAKQPWIEQSVNLAKQLPEQSQSIQALAGILTFSDKIIDKKYAKQIKEEMLMTQVGRLLIEDGIEIGIEKGMAKIIQTMLSKNKTIEEIHRDTDVPLDTIQEIKNSLTK